MVNKCREYSSPTYCHFETLYKNTVLKLWSRVSSVMFIFVSRD